MKRPIYNFSLVPIATLPSKQSSTKTPLSKYPAITQSSRFIVTSTLLLCIAACSDSDNTPANNTSAIPDPAVSGPAPTMPAPGANPDDVIELDGLAGVWQQDCLANDSTQTPYSTSTLSVSSDSGTLSVTNFADNVCSELLSSTTSELSFIFSGVMSSTSLGDAYQVEMTNEQTNDSSHDLMLILNDSLYFGDKSSSLNGSTEELRPVQLDQVYFYSRDTSGQ